MNSISFLSFFMGCERSKERAGQPPKMASSGTVRTASWPQISERRMLRSHRALEGCRVEGSPWVLKKRRLAVSITV